MKFDFYFVRHKRYGAWIVYDENTESYSIIVGDMFSLSEGALDGSHGHYDLETAQNEAVRILCEWESGRRSVA